jgi:hypothetical protein
VRLRLRQTCGRVFGVYARIDGGADHFNQPLGVFGASCPEI